MNAGDLYALPLEEFTAARNALAKELAKSGDATAAEVKRLPKPTKTAWALNQVARARPDDVERLLDAGARVREAYEKALAGDASQLRAATRAEQELVDPLVAAGLSALGLEAASGGAAVDKLRNTLRAAAADPKIGARLREGRVVADLEPSGFGLEGLSGPTTHGPPSAPPEDRSGRQERAARQEAEQLRRAAETARTKADRLAEQADRAERRAQEARQDAADAADAADEAERAAGEAEARVEALER